MMDVTYTAATTALESFRPLTLTRRVAKARKSDKICAKKQQQLDSNQHVIAYLCSYVTQAIYTHVHTYKLHSVHTKISHDIRVDNSLGPKCNFFIIFM